MKVIVSLEVQNCSECPCQEYKGASWSEDVYECKKTGREIELTGIPNHCPFMPTMEKLLESYQKFTENKKNNSDDNRYEPRFDPNIWL